MAFDLRVLCQRVKEGLFRSNRKKNSRQNSSVTRRVYSIEEIKGILSLTSSLEGNEYFLGPGKRLPDGGPELKIDPSLPTDSTSIIEQIIVEVAP